MKTITPQQALKKAAALCSQREMSSADVARKLMQWGLDDQSTAEIIARLTDEGFLDEARYARAFVHDKVAFDRWGRMKIRMALQAKGVSEAVAAKALLGIDEALYRANLTALLEAKMRTLTDEGPALAAKLLRYAAGRGFTYEEVRQCIDCDLH